MIWWYDDDMIWKMINDNDIIKPNPQNIKTNIINYNIIIYNIILIRCSMDKLSHKLGIEWPWLGLSRLQLCKEIAVHNHESKL